MSIGYEVVNIYGYVLDVGWVSMRGRRKDDVCKKKYIGERRQKGQFVVWCESGKISYGNKRRTWVENKHVENLNCLY